MMSPESQPRQRKRSLSLSVAGAILIISGLCGILWGTFFPGGSPKTINLANFVVLYVPLILFGLYLIAFGSPLKKPKRSKTVLNFAVVLLSIFLCFILLELVLRTGVFDDKDNPRPVWIPHKYKKINEAINRTNKAYAQNNPYKFNDKPRPVLKKPDTFRIAILGDSFIWGDGVPYEVIWSHKLENKLRKEYAESIEVFSWGRNGWSTLDQLNFLKEHGIKYNPDLLIVACVYNDPDMGNYKEIYFQLNHVRITKPLRSLLPNAIDFFSEHIEALVNKFSNNIGYPNWEKKLYSEENLRKYFQLLLEFSKFCRNHHIDLLFVLTPNNQSPVSKERLLTITQLMGDAGITYYNLYPAVQREFKYYNQRHLWANPANPHPGAPLTEVYAAEVYKILKENYIKRYYAQTKGEP